MARRLPNGYWTEDRLRQEALQYETRGAFAKANKTAYQTARKAGLLDSICSHMVSKYTTWTEQMLREEALKYEVQHDFKVGNGAAYQAAYKLGILKDICGHMTSGFKRAGERQRVWTKEKCAAEAVKYETRTDFKRGHGAAYKAAVLWGWLDDICGHMQSGHKRRAEKDTIWTAETCAAEALKYETISEFREAAGGAYLRATRLGIMEEICAHMDRNAKPHGYWKKNKARCAEEALKYSNRAAFQRDSHSAYLAAFTQGWLDDICGHMERLASDFDAVYIWRHVGAKFRRRAVYKIGVTSARLGDQRITLNTGRNDMEAELVILSEVPKALELEKKLLGLGVDPGYPAEIEGFTEFRALTAKELDQAVRLIKQAGAQN